MHTKDKKLIMGSDPFNQLQQFVQQARENEEKMRRFQEQELRLISSRSLVDLTQNIVLNYRRAFNLTLVTLVLHDPKYELQRFVYHEKVDSHELPGLIFTIDKTQLEQLFTHKTQPLSQPLLGKFEPSRHGFLFHQERPQLKSVALLPLVRYNELIGSLNLGSNLLQRFQHDSATDFLQRLSTIVSICIENAANHERLKHVGLTDSLTGINNRRFFDQRLGEEIARSLRSQESIACLFLDIDHFKNINDTYGHHTGDHVLREAANIIREQLRNSDVLGRYGGEEFAALLANTTTEAALEIAERIRIRIQSHPFTMPPKALQKPLTVTISIGVTVMDLKYATSDISRISQQLLEQSDQALYAAKNKGRNRVSIFDHKTKPQAQNATKNNSFHTIADTH